MVAILVWIGIGITIVLGIMFNKISSERRTNHKIRKTIEKQNVQMKENNKELKEAAKQISEIR